MKFAPQGIHFDIKALPFLISLCVNSAHFREHENTRMRPSRASAFTHVRQYQGQEGHLIITISSFKGGVGKTTTAIHLAAFLQKKAPTLLVDGDAIRSSTKWAQRGNGHGLPFKVVGHAEMVSHIRNYEHVVIDTEGNPSSDDFRDLALNCDLLVVPAVPETSATDGLTYTLNILDKLQARKFKVLMTIVPPAPQTEGDELRKMLAEQNIPTFKTEIPRLKAFERASAEGVPVYAIKDERAERAWKAYEAAGKEIVAAVQATKETAEKEAVNG
jgi:chromosome partitioning protein